jgi:immune inhibitor A
MMRDRWVGMAGFLALICIATTAGAVPLRPDIVEKLRSEGRLEAERLVMEDAVGRGVNNLHVKEVPGILRGQDMTALTARQAVVILVDFSDNVADTATYPKSHYEEMLFSVGTYPSGSMRDYYLENSYGDFEVTGEVVGWLRMPRTYAYYVNGQRGFGMYPLNAQKLAEDAVVAANPYVDFSQYDNDGPDGIPNSGDDDRYVDAVFIVHAGPGYETTGDVNDIHSHAWSTRSAVPVDMVMVKQYSMEPEDGKIGVFCHEFGHVLGLPDLYDYGYDSQGVGDWSLMAGGAWGGGGVTPTHIDAWGKCQLGFVTPVVPTVSLTDVAFPRVEDEPVIYKVWSNGVPGNEYFLLEHRRKTGFDMFVPGKGLVIYHVDDNMSGNDRQRCGSGSPHYLVAVEQADGECDLEYDNNSGDAGDPWPGKNGTHNPNHAFNDLSTPSSRDYAGSPTGVSIYNIHFTEGVGYASIALAPVGPSVQVTSPSGGECFENGSQDTIRWVAFDDLGVDSVSILLSMDGGATFPEVLATGEANDSVFAWDIDCAGGSDQCRIKVVAYDSDGNIGEGVSEGDFEVSDVSGIASPRVSELEITSIKPNPTALGTWIRFSSPVRNPRIAIYDVTGRLVRRVSAGGRGSDSEYSAYWDGRTSYGELTSPGVYFVRISAGRLTRTARVAVTR